MSSQKKTSQSSKPAKSSASKSDTKTTTKEKEKEKNVDTKLKELTSTKPTKTKPAKPKEVFEDEKPKPKKSKEVVSNKLKYGKKAKEAAKKPISDFPSDHSDTEEDFDEDEFDNVTSSKSAKGAKSKTSSKKKKNLFDDKNKNTVIETPVEEVISKADKRKMAKKQAKVEEEAKKAKEIEEEEAKSGKKKKKTAKEAKTKNDDDEEEEVQDWPSYVRLKETKRKKKYVRDIKVDDFTLSVPGQVLIKKASLTLVENQSYGILGRNGIGKSVFLRKLAHREDCFDKIPHFIKILFVEQEIVGDDKTPMQSVLEADIERQWLLEKEKELLEEAKNEDKLQELREQRAKEREERRKEKEKEKQARALEKQKLKQEKAAAKKSAAKTKNENTKGSKSKAKAKAKTNAKSNNKGGKKKYYSSDEDLDSDYYKYLQEEGDEDEKEDEEEEEEEQEEEEEEVEEGEEEQEEEEEEEEEEEDEEEESEEEDELPKRSYDLRDIYDRLREIESYKAESRAATILAGLGFEISDINTKKTREYSGGWRMRIALARALFVVPDLLILDEPTNHLDLNAVIWLEDYLSNWKKTLLVVSHERTFLGSVANNILHFHNQTITQYKGDYYTFLQVREQNQRAQARQKDVADREKKKMKEYLSHHKGGTGGAGAVKTRQKKLKKMVDVTIDKDDPSLVFSFPDPEPLGLKVLELQEAEFAYPGSNKKIFPKLDFSVDLDSRIAIVGPNGVGKSTLLKLMCGLLKETGGYILRDRKLRLGRFSQHHVDQLDMKLTPLEYLKQQHGAPDHEIRQHLGRFGLTGKLPLHPIDTLSGGQKSRVVFADLAWKNPHIMFLDEPTNHLDMEMIESLGNALNEFQGGIVLVSHNQRLIELVCDELWVVERDGTVQRFEGEFRDYKKKVIADLEKSLSLVNGV